MGWHYGEIVAWSMASFMNAGEQMRLCRRTSETSITHATHKRRPSLSYFAKLAARNRRETDIMLEREPFYIGDVSVLFDHQLL